VSEIFSAYMSANISMTTTVTVVPFDTETLDT